MLLPCFLDFSVGVGALVKGLGHISSFFSISMHILPRMNIMLHFICMVPVELSGAQNKLK